MITEVIGCINCPFCDRSYGVCTHPIDPSEFTPVMHEDDVPIDCPLIKEELTIKLK